MWFKAPPPIHRQLMTFHFCTSHAYPLFMTCVYAHMYTSCILHWPGKVGTSQTQFTILCNIPMYLYSWITGIFAYFASLVKRACSNLVPKRVIECYGIHHIAMPLQSQQLFPGCRVPHLTCPVVASGNEPGARLVKGHICKRKYMSSQHLHSEEQYLHHGTGS